MGYNPLIFNGFTTGKSGGGGTVTAVTASSPLISSGGTSPNLTIQVADSTHSGYLNFTDWNTFNNKGSGTVTSVAFVDSTGLFNISGSPVTTSGTLTLASLQSQSSNKFFASPNGSSGPPTFRSIVAADVPTLNQNTTGTASNITGLLTIANGGTNSSTALNNNKVIISSSGSIVESSVTTTTLSFLDATSSIQTQLNGKQSTLTFGNLTDVGTDGITITGGTGSVIGSGTSISQHVSDSTHNGYLSQTDWSTFNNKQTAGNYITALTGDVSATGPGSVASTLATVNSNTGSFGSSTSIPNFTVNNKGLITAAGTNVVIAPAGTLTGSTLASGVTTSSLTSLGVQTQALNMGTHQINAVVDPSSAQDAATKNYVDGKFSSGDIVETSFSAANNQSSAANVTGFLFSNSTVRSFRALVSVYINATASLYEVFDLQGIQKGSSWDLAVVSNGDSSGIVFSITNAGQIQYTSTNITGFTADTMKFRAITTSV